MRGSTADFVCWKMPKQTQKNHMLPRGKGTERSESVVVMALGASAGSCINGDTRLPRSRYENQILTFEAYRNF